MRPFMFLMVLVWCLFGVVELSVAGEAQASAETVVLIAKTLSDDGLEGRAPETSGHQQSRLFLATWLKEHGFQPSGDGQDTFEQVYDKGVNLIGVLHPPGTSGAGPTVLITAHYDHLGAQCRPHSAAKSNVCNGAADNAGGVAAALAAAEMIAGTIETPVAVALWDNEESGMLGSARFCAEPTFSLTTLRLMINFDIVGLNAYKGLENAHFVIGSETGGTELQDDLGSAAKGLGLSLQKFSYAFGHGRSDMTSFFRAEIPLPFVFFSDGDGSVYHSNADEFEHLNIDKIVAVATMAGRLITTAASAGKAPYAHHRPRTMGPAVPPLFEDAVAMAGLVASVLEHAEQNQISADQIALLQEDHTKLKAMMAGENKRIMRAQTNLLFGAAIRVMGNSRALGTVP